MAAHTGHSNMFLTAVDQILKSWPSLLLAVEQGFGGPESRAKADWMTSAIDTWFRENDRIYPEEVEDFLSDVLNSEFDLRVEDGSVIEISREICLFYRLCRENNVVEMERRLQALPKATTSSFQPAADDEDHGDMESDDESNLASSTPHQPQPSAASASNSTGSSSQPSNAETREEMEEEEEDGWKMIRKGRSKK